MASLLFDGPVHDKHAHPHGESTAHDVERRPSRTPSQGGIDRRRPSLTEKKIDGETVVVALDAENFNASGYEDQLQRQYGLLSICATALTVDSAWPALGGTVVVALYNGGPPGVIWELLVACFYYSFIAASIAELASAVPSAGGVYHWASLTAGSWGRSIGFFCGLINFAGWLFDLASVMVIPANQVMQMYVLWRPDFVIQEWHIFVTSVGICWLGCFTCIFANRFLPFLQTCGFILLTLGGLATIIVLAAMASPHASAASVFTEWENLTGWPSGVAFLTGTLNGAFTIGTPDAVTHIAEELPSPRTDLPKAVAAQMTLGTITSFCFIVTVFFGVSDISAILDSTGSYPLAVAYQQAVGSPGGTLALLLIVFFIGLLCVLATFLTVGRMWWALARDNVTPFAGFFSSASERWSCPIPATILCAVIVTGISAIQLGSKTAFNDIVGSFVILTQVSYALAIFPHLLSGRRNVPKGPFWMGKAGFFVNGAAVAFIALFVTFYCFPYALPTTVSTMNYNSVIMVGVIALIAFWWVVHGLRKYKGPKVQMVYAPGHSVVVTNEKASPISTEDDA